MDDDRERSEYTELLAEFTRGLREHVRPDDSGTHLDLGLAYLEMGLLSDAEAEFELVLRADPNDPAGRAGLELVRHRLQSGSSAIGRA